MIQIAHGLWQFHVGSVSSKSRYQGKTAGDPVMGQEGMSSLFRKTIV
jgi:hypothetical protein